MTTELSVSRIEQSIYFIRGRQVMLDSHLASLYEVKTKVLNQAARRNELRFPGEDFMFQLREDEYNSLRSQIVTLEKDQNPLKSNSYETEGSLRSQFLHFESRKGNHRKFLPTVFTEHGAIMLSGILNSTRAIEINIAVVKAFVEFRRKHSSREERIGHLEAKVDKIDHKLDLRFETLLQTIQQLRPQGPTPSPQFQLPAPAFIDYPTEKTASENPVLGRGINTLVETIQRAVAQFYGIKVQDLKTTTRLRPIALPRQIAIYLIRHYTQLGFKEIGKIFGGKDHTTVMHAFQKIKSSLNENESIRESIAAIEKRIQQDLKVEA